MATDDENPASAQEEAPVESGGDLPGDVKRAAEKAVTFALPPGMSASPATAFIGFPLNTQIGTQEGSSYTPTLVVNNVRVEAEDDDAPQMADSQIGRALELIKDIEGMDADSQANLGDELAALQSYLQQVAQGSRGVKAPDLSSIADRVEKAKTESAAGKSVDGDVAQSWQRIGQMNAQVSGLLNPHMSEAEQAQEENFERRLRAAKTPEERLAIERERHQWRQSLIEQWSSSGTPAQQGAAAQARPVQNSIGQELEKLERAQQRHRGEGVNRRASNEDISPVSEDQRAAYERQKSDSEIRRLAESGDVTRIRNLAAWRATRTENVTDGRGEGVTPTTAPLQYAHVSEAPTSASTGTPQTNPTSPTRSDSIEI